MQSNRQALRQSKLFIKITPKQYLDSFLNGDLKFSKPIEFSCLDKNKGQKDITEAAFKSEYKNGKRVCTRNVFDLEYTRIWCCFALDNYMFTDSIRDGELVKKATVKKEYYDGFLDEKNQNAIIFIKPDDFVNRVFSALVNKGIAPEDILICPITYIRKSEDFVLSCEPPYELFYKDIAYLSQNEVRILIRNSGNKYDCLFDKYGVINIESIRDICKVIDGMYDTNMDCYLISDSKMEFTLPKE